MHVTVVECPHSVEVEPSKLVIERCTLTEAEVTISDQHIHH